MNAETVYRVSGRIALSVLVCAILGATSTIVNRLGVPKEFTGNISGALSAFATFTIFPSIRPWK